MNTILIAFLAIVIIVTIVYAVSYATADYLITDATSLNIGTNSQSSIDSSLLDNPGSSRYYYTGWFFINSNQKIEQENILFNRGSDFVVTLKSSTLNLYVNGGTVDNTKGVFNPTGAAKLISVPDFPFQRWAQLVINVDGMSVDLYIDGKFVQNANHSTTINSRATNEVSHGNKFIIAKVARFKRPAENINPQGVWNEFMKGSGQGQSLTNYHLNAIVTKKQKQTMNKRVF
jgi:hypothetical protein